MWRAIKGYLHLQQPLPVEETHALLVQHAKNGEIEAMEAIIKRSKETLNEIINTKEPVCINFYIIIIIFIAKKLY